MPNTPRIVTRSETTSSNTTENLNKGSKLTFAEMDSNFLELRNGSIGIVGDDSTGIDLAHGSTLKVAGTGGISTTVSGDTLTLTGPDLSSYLTSVSESDVTQHQAALSITESQISDLQSYITDANLTIVGDDSTGVTFSAKNNDDITITGTGGITSTVSGNTVTIDGSGVGGDTTGDITFIGSTMLGPSNADLTLQASGTGNIVADGYHGLKITQNSSPNQFGEITTTGDFGIRLSTNNFNTAASTILIGSVGDGRNISISTPSGKIYLQGGGTEMGANLDMDGKSIISNSNQNIPITPHGLGKIILDGLDWPTADGTSGQVLQTNGGGVLSWVTPSSANTGDITFVGSTMSSPSNANFTIETAGTGKIILTGLTFPDTDGTADQILGTNGSGVLSFRDPTAINIDGGTADSVYTSVPTIDGGTA